jgi:hypothetical protein
VASDSYHRQRAIEKIHNIEFEAIEQEIKREAESEEGARPRLVALFFVLGVCIVVLFFSHFRHRTSVFKQDESRGLTLIDARSDGQTAVRVVVGVPNTGGKDFRAMTYKGVNAKLTVYPGETKYKGAALPGWIEGEGLHFVLDFSHVMVPPGDCDLVVQVVAGAHNSEPLSVRRLEKM